MLGEAIWPTKGQDFPRGLYSRECEVGHSPDLTARGLLLIGHFRVRARFLNTYEVFLCQAEAPVMASASEWGRGGVTSGWVSLWEQATGHVGPVRDPAVQGPVFCFERPLQNEKMWCSPPSQQGHS